MSEDQYIYVYYDGCRHVRYFLRRNQSVTDPVGCECKGCLPISKIALQGKCPVCEVLNK